uniref:STAS domain-containing protein n=1 Tax=Panagrolaimus davidi TaxID=227884 RepID=A0A914PCF3_9BILA
MNEEEAATNARVNDMQYNDYITSNSQKSLPKVLKNYIQPCSSPSHLFHSIISFFPIISWIQEYPSKYLIHDIISGIVIAILHIPQGISYAFLSKVNPVNGLYASFFAPLIYLFFATSKHMSVGSFAVIALMTGAASDVIMREYYGEDYNNPEYINGGIDGVNRVTIAATLTFTIGLFQLLIGALRLNFLFAYFSDPLVGGFCTGASVHVLVSQFSNVLNVQIQSSNGIGFIFDMLTKLGASLPNCDFRTVTLSIISIASLLICKEMINPAIRSKTGRKIPIPYDLILIFITTVLSSVFSWRMPIVGDVPKGFPQPLLPIPKLILSSISPAITIAVVTLTLHISITKMFAKQLGYKIDPGQEIYALGFTSIISGFFPTYPTSPGLSRTLVGIENGAKTQLAAVSTCALLLAVILYIGPFFKHLPICVLSSIIIVALRPMVMKFKDIPKLWNLSKYDCLTWIVSFTTTVAIDVTFGLILSFCFALFSVILRTQWPSWSARFSRPQFSFDPTTTTTSPRYCIFKFDGILIFTNFEEFKNGVHQTLDEFCNRPTLSPTKDKNSKAKFIFDCSAMSEIDSVGLQAFQEVVQEISQRANASLAFANVNYITSIKLLQNNIATRNNLYSTVEEAVNSSENINPPKL